MGILAFLFELIRKHVPITSSEIAGLEKEAKDWFQNEASKTTVGAKVIELDQKWYVRVFLALFFGFASSWFFNLMNPIRDSEDSL
jgi:hypothetical protein